ncbi:MAG: DUF4337 domain-containing protein [Alphaproteobacteria bacterium]|jgi:uncharacterized membrane protein YphA (DoxX/SURF4 family)|nr:DUF4337 domain-containing protein [Alphaproteobacteria bacterium]
MAAGHGAPHGAENKAVALLIAVLALFLAVAEMGAKSAQTEALNANIEAANLWSFFQARTIRQTQLRTAIEQAELDKTDANRAAIEAQQGRWRGAVERWESEPATGEGRRELMERARRAEATRGRQMDRYHMFEYGSAAFQVAIVVASAAIITGVGLLIGLGAGLGALGIALTMLGFFAPGLIHF